MLASLLSAARSSRAIVTELFFLRRVDIPLLRIPLDPSSCSQPSSCEMKDHPSALLDSSCRPAWLSDDSATSQPARATSPESFLRLCVSLVFVPVGDLVGGVQAGPKSRAGGKGAGAPYGPGPIWTALKYTSPGLQLTPSCSTHSPYLYHGHAWQHTRQKLITNGYLRNA